MPTIPPYPLHPEPIERSWLERHAHWKIPLGCMILLLLIGIFGGGLLAIVMTSFHRSDVYKQAVERASRNPQVREHLGEPVRASWFSTGRLSVNGDSGKADLRIPLAGPRGRGSVRAIATKSAGVWSFTYLQVSVEGKSECIDLLSVQVPPERDF